MFSRKPSRTVTGAGSVFPEPLPELVGPADEEEQPAASSRAAPTHRGGRDTSHSHS